VEKERVLLSLTFTGERSFFTLPSKQERRKGKSSPPLSSGKEPWKFLTGVGGKKAQTAFNDRRG